MRIDKLLANIGYGTRKEVKKIPGIRYSKYTWNPAYKGVDDYLLSRVAAM